MGNVLKKVRENNPLIHNITNVVTINDVANVLLALGASPIMADEVDEVEEITSIAQGLLLNLGTLNHRTILAMLKAAKKAKEKGIPIVLDPVGAGASTLRTKTAKEIVREIHPTCIKGNRSELYALTHGVSHTKGVDAAEEDQKGNIEDLVKEAKHFARELGAIVVITGAVDVVADSEHAIAIHNGHPMMAKITGSGCMLGGVITAFLACGEANIETVAEASMRFGIAGEKAYEKSSGPGSFRHCLMDAVAALVAEDVEKEGRYEYR